MRQWFQSFGVDLMIYSAHTSLPFGPEFLRDGDS
jgi:hypothetical protein